MAAYDFNEFDLTDVLSLKDFGIAYDSLSLTFYFILIIIIVFF